MTDDDQLMVRLQEGDPRAFEELVQKYQSPLVGFFHRNTRDVQLSEDLTQETLLRVYNQSWDYLPVGRFRGWMYRIARNLLIDSVRRQSHDALVHASTGKRDDESDALARIAGKLISPEARADQREFAKIVNELLQQIPEDQRMTFTLHHLSGLTLAEVADVMDSSLPTTKSRLRLAREKLREKLHARGVSDPYAPQPEP
jgi:RNA polymerase sigma-70 factor (ECF subfamily)